MMLLERTCCFFNVIGLIILLAVPLQAAMQTDGPLVGGVTETSSKVFVRTDEASMVEIEYSTDPSLALSMKTDPILTKRNRGFTLIISLDGLQSETTYYYRVLVNGFPQQTSPFPSFTTFPHPGISSDFSFAVLADLASFRKFPDLPAPVYAQVMMENPAFVLQIGDFDHSNPKRIRAMVRMHRAVRGPYTAAGLDFASELAPYFPFYHVWDDHDYGVNNGDKSFQSRDHALLAFQAYYPMPDLPNPAGIWHKFTYGQVEVFMLDLRSQRDPNSTPGGSGKSMLDGDNIPNGQKEWLKTNLLASSARWKFLVSSVCFNPTCKPDDGWGGFTTERNELLDFIQQNSIEGVIIVSGDLHSGGGIDNGTNSGLPEITVPHTNLLGGDSGTLGTWSEGIVSGSGNPGYGLITVLTNPDRVIIEAKGVEGDTRKSLVVLD